MQSVDTAQPAGSVTGRPPSVYPGLASFEDTPWHRQLFCGREAETASLLHMVLASPITVLFGRSGLGKTSLINAGLLPALRERGMVPVVVNLSRNPTSGPGASIIARVVEECRAVGLPTEPKADEGLWEFFYRISELVAARKLTIALVLDPFEEVFTVIRPHPGCGPAWASALMNDLADIVRGRVPERVREHARVLLEDESRDEDEASRRAQALLYGPVRLEVKVILSMAEDFLPDLQGFRLSLPTIFDSALRLQPLDTSQARAAIVCPGQRASVLGPEETFTIGDAVVDQMLHFLTGRKPGEPLDDASVEPVQLQMLCYTLDKRRRARGAREITMADLGGVIGMQRMIDRYYGRVLQNVPRVRLGWNARRFRPSRENLLLINRPRAAVRRLCESGLILSSAQRNSLAEPVIRRIYGVPARDLKTLLDRRLLRMETRLGIMFYELSHDTLTNAVRRARLRRRVRRAGLVAAGALLVLAISARYRDQQERSVANALGAISDNLVQQDPVEALRVATVAVEHTPTQRSEAALRAALAGPHALGSRKLPTKAKQVVVSARGSAFIVGEDSTLYVVDPASGRPDPTPVQHSVFSIALSRDQRWVAVGTTTGAVLLETANLRDTVQKTRTTGAVITALSFSRDGQSVIAASAKPIGTRTEEVHLFEWNLKGSEAAAFTPLVGEGARVNALAPSPDGRVVATVHHDSLARIWNRRTGLVERKLEHNGYVYAVAFSPTGRWLVTGGQDKVVSVWQTGSWQRVETVSPRADNVTDVSYSPDGSRLLCATRDRQLVLWKWNGGQRPSSRSDSPGPLWQPLYQWTAHDAAVRSATFTADGRRIVSASDDSTVKVWAAGNDECDGCRPDSLLALARRRLSLQAR